MAMLGANSVEYHRATVMDREDDFAGQALGYYASRGETPLQWGGSGAPSLALSGEVTDRQYSAIFGPGGARDDRRRGRDGAERLVSTTRPGIELVVAAHKSVAELGVIGRAEDMHAILDAERDATLAYLDGMVRTEGGRRGRARTATPTTGLIYAHTRHTTSRAGDPSPHDHVLIANVVEMADERGGWKALDTVAVRDHLHAATIVGRLAGAAKAVDLGYAIVPDHGQSGRLGHWAIAGIPSEVQELHSKRSADIADYLDRTGKEGWRARGIAARETRTHKRHTPLGELLPRWRDELASIGWPAERLLEAVQAADGAERRVLGPLTSRERDRIVGNALHPDGELARAKVFRRRDVVVVVGPQLFGRPAGELRRTVDAVMASQQVIALLPAAGARERVWSLASVLATETAIAATVARGAARTDVAVVPTPAVEDAIKVAETRLARALTDGQREAVFGICQNGEAVSLVEGVAGAGKTTALRCVAEAYRASGFEVLGTATAGQAASTLRIEAAIESRTVASLRWQLDHGRLVLGPRHVVVLDEVGMTTDPDLLRVAAACEVAGAKLVLVGDDRQLGAVGPGGGLGALLERHGGQAHVLDENVRQHDPAEREALAELRAGSVKAAVEHYAKSRRLHVSAERDAVLSEMVDAWATDALAGKDVAMYAWQRRNVETLNALARERWRAKGRLTGEELVAPGGRAYAVGDRIVTLRPGTETVTSERGQVVAVDVQSAGLTARMDDGRLVRLSAEETARGSLAHGYAVTVHRAQGATVDVAHRLQDGGGRELAYVAMSRGRGGGHVWAIADNLAQAKEDLVRDWSREARQRWAIDRTRPVGRRRTLTHGAASFIQRDPDRGSTRRGIALTAELN